jgi:hypothetical protein
MWGHRWSGRPPIVGSPLSYIRCRWGSSLPSAFDTLSLPPPTSPPKRQCLEKQSPAEIVPPPPSLGRSVGGVLGDPLLPLPRWNKGLEFIIEPYMWPSMEALPVAALHFTTLRSASDRLHHPRSCGNVYRFWSSRVSLSRQQFTSYYHLLDKILASLWFPS